VCPGDNPVVPSEKPVSRASFRHWRGEPLIALALLLFAGYCGMSVIHGFQNAKVKRARADLARLAELTRGYITAHHSAPPANDWQRALIGDGKIKSVPNDPWGRPYRFETVQGGIELGTLGRDGVPGGEGPDTDLTQTVPVP
jgi:general secretion pathway protein G